MSPLGTYGAEPLPRERRRAHGADLAGERRRDRERVGVGVHVDELAEALVRSGAVVALEVVLEGDLPVRLDGPLVVGVVAERREVEPAAADDLGQRAERLGERRRPGVRVDEDEGPPRVDGDREQREVRGVEAVLALRARGLPQGAVELVGPGVVGALQRLAAAGLARDRVGAMAADVDERAQHSFPVAGDDDRDVAGVRREVGRRLRHLLGGAGVLPGAGEDALALERGDAFVRVPGGGERPPVLERVLEGRQPRGGIGPGRAHPSPPILTVRSVRILSAVDIGQDTGR